MKIGAVIAEYNPFHNGHKYQIEQIKKECDAVVAIMSGNFVQRGELAVTDKWTRAATAIDNGIDVVIELPTVASLNNAERFAQNGVYIAEKTGLIDCLYFGSENGDITELKNAAEILLSEPPDVSEKIRRYLKEGNSYPKAVSKAHANISSIIEKPNNILGIEYIKALIKYDSKIVSKTVKRIGSGYNETTYTGNFQSACKIRECMRKNEDYTQYVPLNVYERLKNSIEFSTNNLTDLLKYTVLTDFETIKNIHDVTEGIENRILSAVKEGGNFEEMAMRIKCKRYTLARIKRMLMAVVLKLDKEIMKKEPDYIRILGANSRGREILKRMRTTAQLPIVVKTADFSSDILKKDILATDLAYLSVNPNDMSGHDFKKMPVLYDL